MIKSIFKGCYVMLKASTSRHVTFSRRVCLLCEASHG